MHWEMRRKDKQVTSPEWIGEVLRKAEWLELGLAGSDGWPYIVPMNFVHKNGCLIMHGALAGKRADLLAENPRVCFQVAVDTEVVRDEAVPSDFSMKYRSVSGRGTAEIIEDIEQKREALKDLMRRYDGPTEPMPDEMLKKTLVVRVEIMEITGKISGYPKPE